MIDVSTADIPIIVSSTRKIIAKIIIEPFSFFIGDFFCM